MRSIPSSLSCALLLLAAPVLTPGPAGAQSWHEPARGSADRAAIMDAMRPVAASYLGAPVEFVVEDLRVAGDIAFASLDAQRPGGGRIDMASTPLAQQGHYSAPIDRPHVSALLRRRGSGWEVTEHMFSPTEPPFYGPDYCRSWAAVLPEAWC